MIGILVEIQNLFSEWYAIFVEDLGKQVSVQ